MKKNSALGCLLTGFAFLCTPAMGRAATTLVSYQGLLNDSGGQPVNGVVSLTLSLYGVSTGGTALWSESQNVNVSNGLFNVRLGASTALDSSLFVANQALYLGFRVGADQEMVPRQQIAHTSLAAAAEEVRGEVTGDHLARESVWPVHEGRNNTIRSYYAEFNNGTGSTFTMPVDKTFIITDVSFHNIEGGGFHSCALTYTLGPTTETLYKAYAVDQGTSVNIGIGHHDSFRAGMPVPAGAVLRIAASVPSVPGNTGCTVAGFEIPAVP